VSILNQSAKITKKNLQMLEQAVSQTCAIAAAVATLSMQSLDAFDPDPDKHPTRVDRHDMYIYHVQTEQHRNC
jgi:hypothetical protein